MGNSATQLTAPVATVEILTFVGSTSEIIPHSFLKVTDAAIPDVPSIPDFMGYEGIGFRKLLDNMLGRKTPGNRLGCN